MLVWTEDLCVILVYSKLLGDCKMRKYVFVSPHFDDAIGSCGCLMQYLVGYGYKVEVLTVFANRPYLESISDFANSIITFCDLIDGVSERKEENKAACKILGIADINMTFYDAIFRQSFSKTWLYNNFDELFGPVKQSDINLIKSIFDTICKHVSKELTILFFPTAKGGHVDHVIVNEVGKRLLNIGYSIFFYDEFFYNENHCEDLTLNLYKMEFSSEMLNKKIIAMECYKSQHKILFKDGNVSQYYLSNAVKDNKIFEIYFSKAKITKRKCF